MMHTPLFLVLIRSQPRETLIFNLLDDGSLVNHKISHVPRITIPIHVWSKLMFLFSTARRFLGFDVTFHLLNNIIILEEIRISRFANSLRFLFLQLVIGDDILLGAKSIDREFGRANCVHVNLLFIKHNFFPILLFIALVTWSCLLQFKVFRSLLLGCCQIKETLITVLQIPNFIFALAFTGPRFFGFEVFYYFDLLLHTIVILIILRQFL